MVFHGLLWCKWESFAEEGRHIKDNAAGQSQMAGAEFSLATINGPIRKQDMEGTALNVVD